MKNLAKKLVTIMEALIITTFIVFGFRAIAETTSSTTDLENFRSFLSCINNLSDPNAINNFSGLNGCVLQEVFDGIVTEAQLASWMQKPQNISGFSNDDQTPYAVATTILDELTPFRDAMSDGEATSQAYVEAVTFLDLYHGKKPPTSNTTTDGGSSSGSRGNSSTGGSESGTAGAAACKPPTPIDLSGNIQYLPDENGKQFSINAGPTTGTYNVPFVDFTPPQSSTNGGETVGGTGGGATVKPADDALNDPAFVNKIVDDFTSCVNNKLSGLVSRTDVFVKLAISSCQISIAPKYAMEFNNPLPPKIGTDTAARFQQVVSSNIDKITTATGIDKNMINSSLTGNAGATSSVPVGAKGGIPVIEKGPLLNIIANFTPVLDSICANLSSVKTNTDTLVKIAKEYEQKTFTDDPNAISKARGALQAGAKTFKNMKQNGRPDPLNVDPQKYTTFTPTAAQYEAEAKLATAAQIYAETENDLSNNGVDEGTKQQILSQLQSKIDQLNPEISGKLNSSINNSSNVYNMAANIQAVFDDEVNKAGAQARTTLASNGGVAPVVTCPTDALITIKNSDGTTRKICPPTRAIITTPADEISALEREYAKLPVKELLSVNGRQDYGTTHPEQDAINLLNNIPNVIASNNQPNNIGHGLAIGGSSRTATNGSGGGGTGGGATNGGGSGGGGTSTPHPLEMSITPLSLNNLNFSQITWSTSQITNVSSCTATNDWITFGDETTASPNHSVLFHNGESVPTGGNKLIGHPALFKISLASGEGMSDINNIPPPDQNDVKNNIEIRQLASSGTSGINLGGKAITQTTIYTPTMSTGRTAFDPDDEITITLNGASATTRAFGDHAQISADELTKNLANILKNGPSDVVRAFRDYTITAAGGQLLITNTIPVQTDAPNSASYGISCQSDEGIKDKSVSISF